VDPRSYYKILNVAPDANQSEIKNAFRALARIYHPDVNHTPDANRMMQKINEANDVLSDPEKRQLYDRGEYPYNNDDTESDSSYTTSSENPHYDSTDYNWQPTSPKWYERIWHGIVKIYNLLKQLYMWLYKIIAKSYNLVKRLVLWFRSTTVSRLKKTIAGISLVTAVGATAYGINYLHDLYLYAQPCTAQQYVQMQWPFLNDASIELLAQNGQTHVIRGSQVPIVMVNGTTLQSGYDKMYRPVIKCRVPIELVWCEFAGGCRRNVDEYTVLVAKYYLVAYRNKPVSSTVNMSPKTPILWYFVDQKQRTKDQKLSYAVIADTTLAKATKSAIMDGLIPSYWMSYAKSADDENYTSSVANAVPSVIHFLRYAPDVTSAFIDASVDGVLIDEFVNFADKQRLITTLQTRGYTMYMYPIPELHVYIKD
jgi:hypothetical protein